ncbi:MAG: transcription elongation factor GreA [Pseudomonadota bacterium]
MAPIIRTPITKEGYAALKRELERLEREERPKVIVAIAEARSHGDVSENAELDAAREKQALVEGMIQTLKGRLSTAEIIDVSDIDGERAVFGAWVIIENIGTGERDRYQLVGPWESDVPKGRISITSPIGKALVGKTIGEDIRVETPGGVREFEIVGISA